MTDLAQRFESAVSILVGEGPVKQRLAAAYSTALEDLDTEALPAALKPGFEALREAFQRVKPAGNETRVRASVQKMSSIEAGGHASAIVKLYVALLGLGDRAEPLKVVASSTPSPAPSRYAAGRS